MATLVAILISQTRRESNVQARVIGGVITLQIVFYWGVVSLLSIFSNYIYFYSITLYSDPRLYYFWGIFMSPLIFTLCRELVNFVLWQAVKRRLEA